jgi:hypothetical protein
MSFLQKDLLFVRVTPNSSSTKISGKFVDEKNQEYLKINVAAVPEDGKANEELIKFLAKKLKISKSQIEIIRGETSRIKVARIDADISEIDFD